MTDGIADEIRGAERAIRECIEWILREEHGDEWLQHTGMSCERLEELKARQIQDSKRRPGVVPSRRLLDYTEIYELEGIITDNTRWPLFKPVFGDLQRFRAFFKALRSYRNPTMHSRDLVPHEAALLIGIAGEFRAMVAKARVDTDDEDRHFARIESVRDSWGNEASEDKRDVDTGITLHPGDRVVFTCQGFDPTGASLEWWWHDRHGAQQLDKRAEGNSIVWDVDTEHVTGGRFTFSVYLLADRPYHRHGWHDGHVMFRYRVVPAVEGPH